jgi:hypothetical protein
MGKVAILAGLLLIRPVKESQICKHTHKMHVTNEWRIEKQAVIRTKCYCQMCKTYHWHVCKFTIKSTSGIEVWKCWIEHKHK